MASRSGKAYKHARSIGVLTGVGNFFQGVALDIIETSVETSRRTDGDLYASDTSGKRMIGIEIKGSSAAQAFRVSWPQLRGHLERAQRFPYDGFVHILFGYTSRESRKASNSGYRRHLTALRFKEGAGEVFLARRTNQCWIIPTAALKELREKYNLPLERNAFPGQNREALKVRRKFLNKVAQDIKQHLGDGWRLCSGHVSKMVDVNGVLYEMHFPVHMLCHSAHPTLQLQGVRWSGRRP